ncbi:universal stress protein [Saccharomonospora xinjiangensis]|uniref:universal stress protein n=1 Tax=Saccharomonospora xinjiangensis TaxID=75294 RepID=UPI00350F02CF
MTGTDVIAAGVDGSASALHAVAWAAAEAARAGAVLRLVHAYRVPEHGDAAGRIVAGEVGTALRRQGEGWLREAGKVAEATAPGVEVQAVLTEESPATALLDQSRHAATVVVGARGLGGYEGLLAGSMAVALAAHGECPVVVVRGRRPHDPPPAEGPVVVGVDDSEAGVAAVEFAFTEAERRRVPVVAVHVWGDVVLDVVPDTTAHRHPVSADPAEIAEKERAVLDERLAGCRRRHPGVEVEAIVERGRPVRALLAHGQRAQLVVVGSRGLGGIPGMLLGSTSRTLVVHAPCPVAVTRPRQRTTDPHGGETPQ